MSKEKAKKKLYAIEVLIGEPGFIATLRGLDEFKLIPTKIYYRYAHSGRQARLLVDKHLSKFPELDYEIANVQIGQAGTEFGLFEGKEINKRLLK